jgi:hypothetical protein
MSMATAQRCPICLGKCNVPMTLYAGLLATGETQCKSCQGKGYILVPNIIPEKYDLTTGDIGEKIHNIYSGE